jgi:hypothetical protein
MLRFLILSLFAASMTASLSAAAQESAPPEPGAPTAPTPPAATASAPAPSAETATTPSAATAPTPSASPPPVTADEEYRLRMKQLESSVAELKEQIFRSKAKLTLLTEQVQGGSGAGSRIVITHKNQMGGNFLLVEVDYFLDGTPLWQEVDDAGTKLTPKKEYPLWDANIVEGAHTLTVELKYKGNGSGAFQYLAGYQWKLKDAITFTAEPGKQVTIDVVAFEQGGFTTEMTERPKIRFEKNVAIDTPRKPAVGSTAK